MPRFGTHQAAGVGMKTLGHWGRWTLLEPMLRSRSGLIQDVSMTRSAPATLKPAGAYSDKWLQHSQVTSEIAEFWSHSWHGPVWMKIASCFLKAKTDFVLNGARMSVCFL